MADTLVLEAEKREGKGSRVAGKLRAGGRIPGIVYGRQQPTEQVSLAAKPLLEAIFARARVVTLKTAGKDETVLIRELQWDHLGKDLLHIDFLRVSKDQRIEVRVRVELRGTAPGVAGGGILDQPLHELHIECPAVAIPQSIRVSIAELQIDGVIHVKDVVVPEGVKVLDDPEAIVVHIKAPEVVPEPAAASEAGAQAEPEVIGRKAAEEATEE